MANYTPPASFSIYNATLASQSQATGSSTLPTDISPSSLDTLPILSAILTRLQTNTPITNTNSSPHPSQLQSQSFQATSTSSPAPGAAKDPFSTAPLLTKDIPAATDDLKRGLQKTRMLVAQLPDMDRGIAEQEEEIRELEGRIREQRRVLEMLKAMGTGEGLET